MRGDELKPWQMKVPENLRLNWAVELKARKKRKKKKVNFSCSQQYSRRMWHYILKSFYNSNDSA